MEIRLHGRGGQGGVTCAKILAATWARLGMSVQAFGDYAGERSGAPVRAYLRVDPAAIVNRNKVYEPDHLLVLDAALLDDAALLGLKAGGTIVVNTPEAPEAIARRHPGFRVATVDATAIARAHGIGSRSVVIVNTTMAGAFAKAMGLPMAELEAALAEVHVARDVPAARDAYEAVRIREADGESRAGRAAPAPGGVLDLVAHVEGPAPALRTGTWRSSTPRYVTRPAPCAEACPAGNDVVGFVRALATDGVEAAAAILAETTPFAATCGRVCPGFCRLACNREALDGAVDTRGLERWVGDQAVIARAAAPPNGRRAAVVGAGPAGLSAAYQLARAGWRVDLLDAAGAPGGLLRSGIPPWRLPRAALDREIAAVIALGVTFRGGAKVRPDDVATLARDVDAVVVAAGQARAVEVDLGEAPLNGIEQGLDFLRAANHGLAMQVGGQVVVVGGGNTALDCARSALRRGAERVTVVYRRTREQMPALPEEVAEAEEEGVEFVFQRAPLRAHGDDRVGAIELAVVAAGTRGGRLADTGVRDWIPCDTVLLAAGQRADVSDVLPAGWTVRDGRVYEGDRALPVFAAGDFVTGRGTVAHAIGDGARAAARVLDGPEEASHPEARAVVRAEQMRLEHFPVVLGAPRRLRPVGERLRGEPEVALGLEDAREARRCLSCGHCTRCDTCLVYCPEGVVRRAGRGYAVDLDQCKGCGVCARECPRAGMEMVTA
ncbi:MAG: FAD-dependent oxidoreductase [Myxococcota bacterium]